MKLSIVVPAYRQEATIDEDIRRLERALATTGHDYELIVVVDGLVDRTYERALAAAGERVRVLAYRDNCGKGHAVRYGMAQAEGDIVGFIDAGMELEPRGIGVLVAQMLAHGADIVIGSKRHPASRVQYPPLRRLYSWGYQVLVRVLFGLRVKDTQVGLKLFRREVVARVLPLLLVKRFAFDIEFLAVAHALGFRRIEEGPVELTHRFNSTIHLGSVWNMLWDTAAVFYRLRLMRYYQRLAEQQLPSEGGARA
jgi:glycosyltransferase involved in cell wall biosynthesis